jgi:histidine triad (HIT) family protein
MSTIFGKIIKRELPAEIVFENDRIIAIKDKYPAAPVHLLIMPKKEIKDIQSASKEDLTLISECITVAQELAKKFNVQDGYRLITNNGPTAGQTIYHLHFHLVGGRQLGALG